MRRRLLKNVLEHKDYICCIGNLWYVSIPIVYWKSLVFIPFWDWKSLVVILFLYWESLVVIPFLYWTSHVFVNIYYLKTFSSYP